MNLADIHNTNNNNSSNPFLSLNYEPAIESLGDDYYDEVAAAEYPQHILRWRNDALLPILGLTPSTVTDEHFIQAFGKFQERKPFFSTKISRLSIWRV